MISSGCTGSRPPTTFRAFGGEGLASGRECLGFALEGSGAFEVDNMGTGAQEAAKT